MRAELKFARTNSHARLPTQRSGDVGFDLYAAEDAIVPKHEHAVIDTGIVLADVPRLYIDDDRTSMFVPLLKIEGRSGLAAKSGIIPIGGIIDPSYRGNIRIILHNMSSVDFNVRVGDKIAQLVWYCTIANVTCGSTHSVGMHVDIVETDRIVETSRGDAGFGSTGM